MPVPVLPRPTDNPDGRWGDELVRGLEQYIVGLEFRLSASFWTRVPIHWFPDTTATPPTQARHIGGIAHFAFSAGADQTVSGNTTFPSGYVPGTSFYCVVGWYPVSSAAGNVRWELEYTVCNSGGVLGAPTIVSVDTATPGVAYQIARTEFPVVTASGIGIPAVFTCRLTRETTGVTDHYGAAVGLLTIHIIVQENAIGSRERYAR